MQPSFLLCGCGWLGHYLIPHLAPKYTLLGTTRSTDKASALQQLGVDAYCYQLGDNHTALPSDLSGAQVLLNIPPGRKGFEPSQFVDRMTDLIDYFVAAGAAHIVFVSTTAVYGKHTGYVTQATPRVPVTPSGQAHVLIEDYLLSQYKTLTTILRPAGLVGPDRHPINTLAGRALDKGNQVANLVHVEDICQAVQQVAHIEPSGQSYLLCATEHPKRADYYLACAKIKALPAPSFADYEPSQPAMGKQIEGSWEALGLTPKYASPYDML